MAGEGVKFPSHLFLLVSGGPECDENAFAVIALATDETDREAMRVAHKLVLPGDAAGVLVVSYSPVYGVRELIFSARGICAFSGSQVAGFLKQGTFEATVTRALAEFVGRQGAPGLDSPQVIQPPENLWSLVRKLKRPRP